MNASQMSCLVIGGSDQMRYGDRFWEVGGHTSARFGAGQDWMDPAFWYRLWQQNRTFMCAMFDRGSESWFHGMSSECLEACAFVLSQLSPILLIEDQIVADGFTGLFTMTRLRKILEDQHGYETKAFFRIERNAVILVCCRPGIHPPLDDQILPITRMPDHIPSVSVMPYSELTPIKDVVAAKFM
jgi:hypothetical protein